jgi:2-(1,2-epoxy-1,2-dihydrophenyl)acetyl-CoA isomerase
MTNPTFDNILYEQDGAVAIITLNRPERLNALNMGLMTDLQAGLRHALDGGQTRAVVLTGAGRGFCAGADLSMARGTGADIDGGMRDFFNPTVQMVSEYPLPLVTAVNGPAAGGGSSLALAGDMVLAAESAYFQQSFSNIGLVPDMGASWVLPRTLSRSRASALAMLGENLPAREAAEWGLILRAVPDAQLLAEARALAQRLAGRATVALSLAKRLLRQGLDNSLRDQLLLEQEFQRTARATEDATEARKAFLEKRPAVFKGR